MYFAGVNIREGYMLEDVDYDTKVCYVGSGNKDFLGGRDRAEVAVRTRSQ